LGRLGFVITQSVFKTKGAGDGFRRLAFRREGEEIILKPIVIHDLSEIGVFEGVTNRTAVFVSQKQRLPFDYPVSYIVWSGPSVVEQERTIAEVLRETVRKRFEAVPVEPKKPTSPWLTAPHNALAGIVKVLGKSEYKGYEGVNTGGLNGCFWIRVIKETNDGDVLIENLSDVGKIKVERVQTSCERDLIYPHLRGRDVSRWLATPSGYIVLAQDPATGKGIAESEMKKRQPKTFSYLKRFEGSMESPKRGTLRGRALYKQYFRPTHFIRCITSVLIPSQHGRFCSRTSLSFFSARS